MGHPDAFSALEQAVRGAQGRILAALTRRFGISRFDLIDNAVQDACLRALETWPRDGVPQAPDRWLVQVAHHALVNSLRHESRSDSFGEQHDSPVEQVVFDPDDELRLLFLCCHPALGKPAQIALTLNVAFGLSARRIARTFLIDERTVAQRLVRAKQTLRTQADGFELPQDAASSRLDTVLEVLYAAFAEGDGLLGEMSSPDDDVAGEALHFARLLAVAPRTGSPAAMALRALMCLHSARRPARLADDGSLLLIQEQDRARWDRALIEEAFACLQSAAAGDRATRYHIEAAIAACHTVSPSYAMTDWSRIVSLYDDLRELAPSMVVDLNRALAVSLAKGTHAGLEALDAIPERELLARYPFALCAYAELHTSLGQLEEALAYLDRALAHQTVPAQQRLLLRKRQALDGKHTVTTDH